MILILVTFSVEIADFMMVLLLLFREMTRNLA